MILENLGLVLLEPRLKEARLTEPGEVIRRVRTLQIFHGGILGVRIVGAKCRRRRWTILVARIEHPWLPCAGQRRYWRSAAPHSSSGGKRPRERLTGPIGFGVCNYGLSNLVTEIHTR